MLAALDFSNPPFVARICTRTLGRAGAVQLIEEPLKYWPKTCVLPKIQARPTVGLNPVPNSCMALPPALGPSVGKKLEMTGTTR